jgi:FkbM family methyltransferase
MRDFMSQFVRAGQLVFDIGASRGEYTEMYDWLDARVVAIEPHPDLVGIIRRRVPAAIIEQIAVGAQEGAGELWIGAGEGESTLSDAYREILQRTTNVKMRALTVRVVTLDSLIARYGVPDFVKIDVEGYETAVLSGLTTRLPALSFEFHGSLLSELRKCLSLLGDYRYRMSVGYDFEWSSNWCNRDELLNAANRVAQGRPDLFADVYAVDSRTPI